MECKTSPFALQTVQHDHAFDFSPFGIRRENPLTEALARLRHEKEILETGLANCVTYLLALRKKQARNVRKLTTDPLPPRKKRKKIQQSNRELEKEIKNHERDEGAYLNNLQACKTNIYMTQGFQYAAGELLSPGVDTSSTTQYSSTGSELAEMSWNGWMAETPISPFEAYRYGPFVEDDVAPDEPRAEAPDDTIPVKPMTPHPLQVHTAQGLAVREPPHIARPSYLSPVAAAFEPNSLYTQHEIDDIRGRIDSLDLLPSPMDEYLDETTPLRRNTEVNFSDVSPGTASGLLPKIVKERNHTWCDKIPQRRRPQKDILEEEGRLSRANSM